MDGQKTGQRDRGSRPRRLIDAPRSNAEYAPDGGSRPRPATSEPARRKEGKLHVRAYGLPGSPLFPSPFFPSSSARYSVDLQNPTGRNRRAHKSYLSHQSYKSHCPQSRRSNQLRPNPTKSEPMQMEGRKIEGKKISGEFHWGGLQNAPARNPENRQTCRNPSPFPPVHASGDGMAAIRVNQTKSKQIQPNSANQASHPAKSGS
jgi:hypothetical protein